MKGNTNIIFLYPAGLRSVTVECVGAGATKSGKPLSGDGKGGV